MRCSLFIYAGMTEASEVNKSAMIVMEINKWF